jgi:outer membrane translocation and assembly module TamA
MPRKKKRNIIDELFEGSIFNNTESLFDKSPSTRYSISVLQTPEGTKVKAKVGKNTDSNALRKQLQQQYPNAKIEIEGGKTTPLIREISTKTLKQKNKKEEKK